MEFLRHILRLFVVVLFSGLGTSMAFAASMNTSDLSFYQAENALLSKADSVGFAARAPPLAVSNVAVTGGATSMQGSGFAFHGQERAAALFGFDADHIGPNRTPQVTINRQNGAEFEQQVIDALGPVGGVKNTTPQTVTLSNGTEVTTIPDLWGRNVGGLLEAKNVQNLSLSRQLRAQAQIARESGQPLNLVVSSRTQRVSGPLLNDVRSTGGNVFVYNPATDSLTPW